SRTITRLGLLLSASSNEYVPGDSVTPGSATGALNLRYSVRFIVLAFRLLTDSTRPSTSPLTAAHRVRLTIVLPSLHLPGAGRFGRRAHPDRRSAARVSPPAASPDPRENWPEFDALVRLTPTEVHEYRSTNDCRRTEHRAVPDRPRAGLGRHGSRVPRGRLRAAPPGRPQSGRPGAVRGGRRAAAAGGGARDGGAEPSVHLRRARSGTRGRRTLHRDGARRGRAAVARHRARQRAARGDRPPLRAAAGRRR